jgi:hypothetical protein
MSSRYTHLFAVIDDQGSLVVQGHSNVEDTVDLITVPAEQASSLSSLAYFIYDHRHTPFLWSTEADFSPFAAILDRTALAVNAYAA